MSLALGIYATLATIACAVCALGWRWQTRLTDRVLDIADEAQEHALTAEKIAAAERAGYRVISKPGAAVHVEEHVLTAEERAGLDCGGLLGSKGDE